VLTQLKCAEEFTVKHKGFLYAFTINEKKGGWLVIKADGETILKTYEIRKDGCSCPGSYWRGQCWHYDAVAHMEYPEGSEGRRNIFHWLAAYAAATNHAGNYLREKYREIILKKYHVEPEKFLSLRSNFEKLEPYMEPWRQAMDDTYV